MSADLAEMLRYNAWANRTLLDFCRTLPDKQLDVKAPGASGPTRELLVHIAGGQQTFILRTKGRQHEGELSRRSAWPGFAALSEIITRTNDELIAIADSLDPAAEVDLPYMSKTYRFPARFFLVHAAAHGTEHRTEIKLNLAQLGLETPDLDAWQYAAASGYGQEV